MRRRSRAESQAETRERLLAAATDLFLRDGYSATSLGKVAEEAGYSKGAVYSNFRNKDELCLAVLDGIRARQNTEMTEALSGADGLDALLAAFTAWWERTVTDETWFVLETEYLAHARRDPQLRTGLSTRYRETLLAVTDALTSHLEHRGVTLPIPAETAGTALFGMAIGLGLLRSVHHELDLGALPAMLALLVSVSRDPRAHAIASPGHPDREDPYLDR